MSKSLGNVVTVRQLLAKWPAEVIRLNMLKTHYRKPLDWTEERLREAKDNLDRWYRVIQGAGMRNAENPPSEFLEVLGDDLNTPAAIGAMEEIEDQTQLKAAGEFLGVFQQRPEAWFKRTVALGTAQEKATALGVTAVKTYSVEGIEKLIVERKAAREAKNFAMSDRIRDELAEQGIILEDKPDGTTDWRRA